ncbi:MAG: DUF177 domain-containing protein [Tannerellaceae bacterium]|nr:DUF177 domain-containing protein [Tannerellaceae bacterium]
MHGFLQLELVLGTLKRYQIDLKSFVPATMYEFNYVLGNDFFEDVDGPEVKQGNVNVSLSVVHVSSVFELEFHMKGIITVPCDRCLDDMDVPVETENRLVVTFGEAYAETSDEHIIVSKEEGFINIAWYMYEFIALAIPIKHVHEPGGCNEKMASKLNELCVDEVDGDDLFHEMNETNDDIDNDGESFHKQGHRPIDPRWDALRNLMEDN